MPIKYKVLNNGNLVIVQWVGDVSFSEMIEHNEILLQDSSIVPGATVLTDTTKADAVNLEISRIHELVEIHQRPDNLTSISRYAVLVSTESLEFANAVAEEAEKVGVSIIVFASIDVAALWVGLETSQIIEALTELSKR